MALHTSSIAVLLTSLVLPLLIPNFYSFGIFASTVPAQNSDVDHLQFVLNLEFLEAEFYLKGATGRGLDATEPELAQGGPPPIGGESVPNLDPLVKDVMHQLGLQEVGHIRTIKRVTKGFPRPLLNISKEIFAQFMNQAFGRPLRPPFNPYANTVNYVLASYAIAHLAPTAYVGISPKMQRTTYKKLVAGLLGVDAGQDAVIRSYLYVRRNTTVTPYRFSVAEFTDRISELGNKLGKEGIKSEGLVVPPSEGAEGRVSGNVLSADKDSLFFEKSPETILRIVYGSGDEHVPGGLFPKGANGRIAKSFLNRAA